jgi:hypothetical protein
MYRFSIDGEEWILRFSPQVTFESEEKDVIVKSILKIGRNLPNFTHGDAFLVEDKNIGIIVFKVERVPSLIITVSNIVPRERCYFN